MFKLVVIALGAIANVGIIGGGYWFIKDSFENKYKVASLEITNAQHNALVNSFPEIKQLQDESEKRIEDARNAAKKYDPQPLSPALREYFAQLRQDKDQQL